MQAVYRMVVAGAVGVIVGAAAMDAIRAETATPPAYLIGNIAQITDPALFAQYGKAAGDTLAAYGGRPLVRTDKLVAIDASPLPKGIIAVLQFPSMNALKRWWNSPEYSAARPLRERSTVGSSFAAEGLAAP